MYSNATVAWTELEIRCRDSLVSVLSQLIEDVWCGLNPAIRMCRVETPILTPATVLQSHTEAGFHLLRTQRGVLRPETTAGCVHAFEAMFPIESQREKRMPYCVWQSGKSFREEARPETMRASRLRLVEFWQLEFDLFCASGTRAPYLERAAEALRDCYGGCLIDSVGEDLPHYSRRTLDWYIGRLEVAGMSERTDWAGGVIYEVSIGLDRLVGILHRKGNNNDEE